MQNILQISTSFPNRIPTLSAFKSERNKKLTTSTNHKSQFTLGSFTNRRTGFIFHKCCSRHHRPVGWRNSHNVMMSMLCYRYHSEWNIRFIHIEYFPSFIFEMTQCWVNCKFRSRIHAYTEAQHVIVEFKSQCIYWFTPCISIVVSSDRMHFTNIPVTLRFRHSFSFVSLILFWSHIHWFDSIQSYQWTHDLVWIDCSWFIHTATMNTLAG